jgi:hypothetical protein
MKEELCKAFCARLHVERVPSGWAIQTPYKLPDGDPVMFFIITVSDGVQRLEDNGATVAMLEASGVSLEKKGARFQAFQELLVQHGASYDDDAGVICTVDMPTQDIPDTAVNFTALMLRVHDLAMLSVERVSQSWRDDALRDIHEKFDATAKVEEQVLVSPKVGSIAPDVVIRPVSGPPVAIFLGTTQAKGLTALVLKMEMEKYQEQNYPVVLIIERAKDNPIAEGTLALAQSRLNGVHTYRGAEFDMVEALTRYVQPNETLQ